MMAAVRQRVAPQQSRRGRGGDLAPAFQGGQVVNDARRQFRIGARRRNRCDGQVVQSGERVRVSSRRRTARVTSSATCRRYPGRDGTLYRRARPSPAKSRKTLGVCWSGRLTLWMSRPHFPARGSRRSGYPFDVCGNERRGNEDGRSRRGGPVSEPMARWPNDDSG